MAFFLLLKKNFFHNPNLYMTACRTYVKFLLLLKQREGKKKEIPCFLVPTLTVDLIWHTHMLRPVDYYEYSLSKVGVFIDHDDDLTYLDDSTNYTSSLWQKVYHEQYIPSSRKKNDALQMIKIFFF